MFRPIYLSFYGALNETNVQEAAFKVVNEFRAEITFKLTESYFLNACFYDF